jgi:hypothetical protein
MNIHKNARLTPQGRLLLVERITEAVWSVVRTGMRRAKKTTGSYSSPGGVAGRTSFPEHPIRDFRSNICDRSWPKRCVIPHSTASSAALESAQYDFSHSLLDLCPRAVLPNASFQTPALINGLPLGG